MQSIFDNLINGNLSDARRLARRASWHQIYKTAIHDLGWADNRAIAAADYLKSSESEKGEAFQRYCDAK